MQTKIVDIGLFFPQGTYSNAELQSDFPDLKVRELTRLTGVETRHICAKNETSVDMGIAAANNLFENSKIDRSIIDYLIFCSAGGDYITPASACVVHELLGLNTNCGALDINQGCTGYIHALSLANGLLASGTASHVLIITAEAISKMVNDKDKSNKAIFGDGAAASLISKSDESKLLSKFMFGTDGSKFDQIIIKHGRERYPLPQFEENDFVDEFGVVRNNANIYMNGSEVFNFSINKAPELIENLLDNASLSLNEIDHFIFHQSNRILLETLGKKLKIDGNKIIMELKENGNTISSSIPIALKMAVDKSQIKRGDKILLAGFGVGFSWGGIILEY